MHDPGDENDYRPTDDKEAGLAAVAQYCRAQTSNPPDWLLHFGPLTTKEGFNLQVNRDNILTRATLTEFPNTEGSGSGGIL